MLEMFAANAGKKARSQQQVSNTGPRSHQPDLVNLLGHIHPQALGLDHLVGDDGEHLRRDALSGRNSTDSARDDGRPLVCVEDSHVSDVRV